MLQYRYGWLFIKCAQSQSWNNNDMPIRCIGEQNIDLIFYFEFKY